MDVVNPRPPVQPDPLNRPEVFVDHDVKAAGALTVDWTGQLRREERRLRGARALRCDEISHNVKGILPGKRFLSDAIRHSNLTPTDVSILLL